MIQCIKTNLSKFALVILVLFFLIVNYKIKVEEVVVYEDVVASAIDGKIEFPFENISGFAVRDNNKENQSIYENHQISFELGLYKDGEEIWKEKYEAVQLHATYFVEIVNGTPDMIEVEKGESYQIQVTSADVDLTNVSVRFYGDQKNFGAIYLAISIVSLLLMIMAIIAIDRINTWRLERVFLVLLLGLGILWNMVTPPISVPDEEYHLGQAWMVSDRLLGTTPEEGVELMVPEDINFVRYCQVKQTLYSFYDHLWDADYNSEYMIFDGQLDGSNVPFYSHLIPGIGIAIGRILNLNYEWIMICGRMASLLAASLLIAWTIRIIPFGEKNIFAVSLFPMSINLLGSLSYDSLNLAFIILFFAMCMNCIYAKKKMEWKDVLSLALIAALFVPIKVIYLPIVLLCCLIPISKYGSKVKWLLGSGAICLSACSILAIQRFSEVIGMLGISLQQEVTSEAQQYVSEVLTEPARYTFQWVLNNPVDTIKIFINTLYECGDSYLMTAVGSRFNDVTISTILIFGLLLIYILLSLNGNKADGHGFLTKIAAGGISLSILGLAMVSMFFAYTNYGDYLIAGVQGRYLLPIFLVLPLLIRPNVVKVKDSSEHALMKLFIAIDIVVFLAIFTETLRW